MNLYGIVFKWIYVVLSGFFFCTEGELCQFRETCFLLLIGFSCRDFSGTKGYKVAVKINYFGEAISTQCCWKVVSVQMPDKLIYGRVILFRIAEAIERFQNIRKNFTSITDFKSDL